MNNAILCFYEKAENSDSKVVCWGSWLLNSSNEIIFSYGNFLKIRNVLLSQINAITKIIGLRFYKQIIDTSGEDKIVEVISGANLFIRRNIIEKEGFFDENFFMYHEENDFQRRLFNKGYKSQIFEGPQILHLEGSSSKYSIIKLTIITTGLFTYIKKWNTPLKYVLFRLFFGIMRIFPLLFSSKYKITEKIKYIRILIS
jgi:GT2 family glycosyltransferase